MLRKAYASGKVQWHMLVAHHAACDFDHTYRICRLRICTRCFGILLGMIIGYSLIGVIPSFAYKNLIWFSFLFPLPAVADFTTHEIGLWQSNNGYRLVSGLFLGSLIGIGVYVSVHKGLILFVGLIFLWLATLEFGAAMILRCAGQLDKYIERYEKSVRK